MNYRRQIYLNWKVGYSHTQMNSPEEWMEAQVPGAVQMDYARANNLPDYCYGTNCEAWEWMENRFWTYECQIPQCNLQSGEKVFWIAEGIDYQFEMLVDGEIVHSQEGMFTPVQFDITNRISNCTKLQIRIFRAPKWKPEGKDHTQALYSVKPPVSYGWDWHPHLVPLGIWKPCYLEIRGASYFEKTQLNYNLSEDLQRASIELCASIKNPSGTRIQWKLLDTKGNVCLEQQFENTGSNVRANLSLCHPDLWWPHDQGIPTLYSSIWNLQDAKGQIIDSCESKVGFRKVRMVMGEGTWDTPEPAYFPKTRSPAPMTVEINGRSIFCKGSNWVNPDIFPGRVDRNTYSELLEIAKNTHFNILRIWGGAPVNKSSFYEICDELGILVWQDFPLACLPYTDDPHYLETLDQESRSIIESLKPHPSVVLWCGGNELLNRWSGMTDQSLPLRLLNRNCFELDPGRPFIPSAPIEGMGHGHYLFRDSNTGIEAWESFQNAQCTAYSEFGMPAPAALDYLRQFIPEEQLVYPPQGDAWTKHHASNAWVVEPESWMCQSIIEHYFGPSNNLETLLNNGRILQGIGYQGLYEEARRQKPYCSMALNWCFNEPWPTAANNSLLSWPAIPKPALEKVREACRPVLFSARVKKAKWRANECFQAELWILNDSNHTVEAGIVSISVQFGEAEIPIFEWHHPECATNQNLKGPILQWNIPASSDRTFELKLVSKLYPTGNSHYILFNEPCRAFEQPKGLNL